MHDELPANLEALSPEFLPAALSDPFDGKTLRYAKLDKGFVVYSVGLNEHDDGGSSAPTNPSGSETQDIVFRVER